MHVHAQARPHIKHAPGVSQRAAVYFVNPIHLFSVFASSLHKSANGNNYSGKRAPGNGRGGILLCPDKLFKVFSSFLRPLSINAAADRLVYLVIS